MIDTPNTDKLQALVESGALDIKMTNFEKAVWHLKGIAKYVADGRKKPEDVVSEIKMLLDRGPDKEYDGTK